MKVERIFTAGNEVGARLYFHRVCDSVHRGGVCLSVCWDTTPPDQEPSRTRHPPLGPGTPWDQAPPRPTPPDQAPPPRSTAYWEIRSTSGRYASYCNAILVYFVNFTLFGFYTDEEIFLSTCNGVCDIRYTCLYCLIHL